MRRRRILFAGLVLALSALVLVGGLMGLAAWQDRRAQLIAAQERIDALAFNLAAHAAFALDEAHHALSSVGAELRARPRPFDLPPTALLGRHAHLAPGLRALELFDPHGTLLAASNVPPERDAAGLHAFLAAWSLDAAPGPALAYGAPGERALPVAQPLSAADGRPLGVLVALLDPAPLTGFYGAQDLGPDRVELHGDAGHVLLTLGGPDANPAAPTGLLGHGAAWTRSALDRLWPGWALSVTGEPALETARAVPGYPLSVTVSKPVASALHMWLTHVTILGLAGLVILLGMLGITLVASRQAVRAQRARLATQARMQDELESAARHQRVLYELARQDKSDFTATVKQLLAVAADHLEVERVSYWELDDVLGQLACRYLYRRAAGALEPGALVLRTEDAPEYFHALQEQGVLAVSEVQLDARTSALADTYLRPLGIASLLDVPVLLRGRLVGILCHEHVGGARRWDERDQAFARAVAEMIALSREAAERKRAEQDLRRERELAQVTLESITDAVIRTDPAGQVEYLNGVAETLTGWRQEQAVGRSLGEVLRLFEEGTREPLAPALQCLGNGAAVTRAAPARLVSRDGREFVVEETAAPLRDADGRIMGAVLVFRDVTERHRIHRELAYQATHDSLTRLMNRREFERRLAGLLDPAGGGAKPHALLYIDLDQFKVVNDTCGHPAGDELLRRLTKELAALVRPPNALARLGGDEFGVLLVDCTAQAAQALAARLLEAIRAFRFPWQDKVFTIGASIGVVPIEGRQALPALLAAADSACYAAKDKGRNRVQLYAPGDQDLVRRRDEMSWVARITRALEENRFELFYQPIRPTRAAADLPPHDEILLRLREPNGALVLPYAFIPAAERYNLMPTLDQWVVQHVFAALRQHRAQHPDEPIGRISINLSGHSLGDEAFAGFIREQFEHYEVPHTHICFEITETAAIANLQRASAFLREMRALGCTTALDDFGAGLSSFAYLKTLEADYLKIDGSFIRGMLEDPMGSAIVEAINRVGHLMGIKTVAEFVESPAVLRRLAELGVDYVQGNALQKAKPWPLTMPAEAI